MFMIRNSPYINLQTFSDLHSLLCCWISWECVCWSAWYSSGLGAQVKHGRYACASHHKPQSRRYTLPGPGNRTFHSLTWNTWSSQNRCWRAQCVRERACEFRMTKGRSRRVFISLCTRVRLQTCPITSAQSPRLGLAATPQSPESYLNPLKKLKN